MARGRSFWLMIMLMALGMGAQVGVYTMMPLFLTTERGMEVGAANTLMGLANLSPLVMVFVAGRVSDRIGERRAIFAVLVLTGVATVLLGLAHGAALVVVGLPAARLRRVLLPACVLGDGPHGAAEPAECGRRPRAAAGLRRGRGARTGGAGLRGAARDASPWASWSPASSVVLGSVGAFFLRLLEDDQIEDGC